MNQFTALRCLFAIACGLVLLPAAGCENGVEPFSDRWALVWQDDFSGNANSLPDSAKWNFDVGTGWGNNQLEYDTKRPDNASLDGKGNLIITAKRESFGGQNYTSARITTKGKFQTLYGRVEARMKLPWGQGIWPAFWMLGAAIDSLSWPACGEIDIMELRGQLPTRIAGSVHGPGYSGANAITKPFDLNNDRFDTGFHSFAVEWGPSEILFFVDDILYQQVKPANLTGEWVFNKPFFILLNLAVGGNYVGAPSGSTIFPQSMVVDYVRVYEAKK